MAKTKRELLAPLVVGKDSMGNPVTLSDRTQRDILQVPEGSAREAFKQAKIEQAVKSAEGKIKYLGGRDKLAFSQTSRGYLVIKGTGTRQDAIFSKKQALALIEQFEALKQFVSTLPNGN